MNDNLVNSEKKEEEVKQATNNQDNEGKKTSPSSIVEKRNYHENSSIDHENDQTIVAKRSLLYSGSSYGRSWSLTHPRTRQFVKSKKSKFVFRKIYSRYQRKAITIKTFEHTAVINVNKTQSQLLAVYNVIKEMVENQKKILFVGTKSQFKKIIAEEAIRCQSYFVNERWLGGTFTNFSVMRRRILSLVRIESTNRSGLYQASLPKKELAKIQKNISNLYKYFSGIVNMQQLPDAVIVFDIDKDYVCINEAKKFNIPVIGILNTNNNPLAVDYPIIANNRSYKTIKLVATILADAILAGNKKEDEQLIAWRKNVVIETVYKRSEDGEELPKINTGSNLVIKYLTDDEFRDLYQQHPRSDYAMKQKLREQTNIAAKQAETQEVTKTDKRETIEISEYQQYKNLSLAELQAIAKERKLIKYSQLRKQELIEQLIKEDHTSNQSKGDSDNLLNKVESKAKGLVNNES